MTSMTKPAPFDFRTQYTLPFQAEDDEIIVDLFAGGGGASTGLEMGLGRTVAIAINHNPAAISMHEANHPGTKHYQSDVWAVDPADAVGGRRVGWLHASPDCTHHSQAAGGQPRKKEIRDLSWVALKWLGRLRSTGKPARVFSLENVKQIKSWGPLVAKRCKKTGRVIRLDGTVALPGERVPREQQYLVPDPKRKGATWRNFLRSLEGLGYDVGHWVTKNCDYGDPTIRERLYLIARCDGVAPAKPEATHAPKPVKGQAKWRTAADCIDWSDLGKSIFERPKPLADATQRRIAKGVFKEVINRKQPFIVPIANWSRDALHPVDAPLNTVTAWPRGGSFALATPVLVGAGGPVYSGKPVSADKPLGSLLTENHRGIATALLAQANGGFNTMHSRPADAPFSTVTNTGSQQQLVTANLVQLNQNCDARPIDEPVRTVNAGGTHHALATAFLSRQFGASIGQAADHPAPTVTAGGGGKSALVECVLSPEVEAGAQRVAAFLINYYGRGESRDPSKPLDTVTTKDRLALVTVWIGGDPYVIVDIRFRMLKPRELYRAQGFPESYIIDRGHDGRAFNKSQQVHMCGNSVSPGTMAAYAAANNPWRPACHQVAAA